MDALMVVLFVGLVAAGVWALLNMPLGTRVESVPDEPEEAPAIAFPDAVDVRHLESLRMRVKGTAYYVPERQRATAGSTVYVLVREPENPHDSSAVAIYAGDKKVGHVSRARAAIMAPELDRIGKPVIVSGAAAEERNTRLWVDIPKAEALRAFARSVVGPDEGG